MPPPGHEKETDDRSQGKSSRVRRAEQRDLLRLETDLPPFHATPAPRADSDANKAWEVREGACKAPTKLGPEQDVLVWIALVSSAMPRAVWPFHGSPGEAAASLGRPTWPRPSPFLKAALALAGSKLPVASTSFCAFSCQTHSIWDAFSSSVDRKSTRL